MSTASKLTKQQSQFEYLQGGQLPEADVRDHLAELKKKLGAAAKEKAALRQEAAKYFSQIEERASTHDSVQATQAIEGLRGFTERLAKQKPAVPRKVIVPPVTTWGTYTLQFAPWYSGLGIYTVGEISSVTGDPTISATGVNDLGQLSCSVFTNYEKPSAGTASNLMGIYFKPIFNEATVRITFQSELAFYWYVNSIRNKEAISEAQGLIELYQYDGAFVYPALARGAFLGWGEVGLNSLNFDVISENGPTWALEAPVSSQHWYFVVISLSCTASGSGWPGALAGASATVTVPSITVTVTAKSIVLPEA
jgi:hypothetical protein